MKLIYIYLYCISCVLFSWIENIVIFSILIFWITVFFSLSFVWKGQSSMAWMEVRCYFGTCTQLAWQVATGGGSPYMETNKTRRKELLYTRSMLVSIHVLEKLIDGMLETPCWLHVLYGIIDGFVNVWKVGASIYTYTFLPLFLQKLGVVTWSFCFFVFVFLLGQFCFCHALFQKDCIRCQRCLFCFEYCRGIFLQLRPGKVFWPLFFLRHKKLSVDGGRYVT